MIGSVGRSRVWAALVLSLLVFTSIHATPEEELGKTVVRTLQEGDGDGFAGLLDRASVVDRALHELPGSEAFIAEVRKGLEVGLARVGELMVTTMGASAKLSYVRTRGVDGVPRALVRVDLGDRGINYLDFFLHKMPDGSWTVYDWLDYVQGQTYTESLRMAMALMVKEQPSLFTRLLGLSDVDKKSAKLIAKMGQLGQQGDWSGWLATYRDLPDALRTSRILLANRVAAASALGDQDEYLAAMADLHASQGDDPTLSLTLVDYYLLTEDYLRAYKAVDRLEEYTGGDAALTNLRAGIALYQGDHAATIRYARQAIELDADYEDPYWNLMVAGSRSGDFAVAMEGVRRLEDRFGYTFSEQELAAHEDFGKLVASEEWKSAAVGVP